ncbi:MAG TPA: heavy metal-responsive transcriptional regulator [Acidimicrobiia bacterium]|nr:heavy metal-responsive transcriptional regulator [Acidimicrobiia bacterium]
MRIGELGRQTDVSAKTIRYYEEIGLLPEPERAQNGYREYRDDVVMRLQFIRDAQSTGLTLTEIGSILDLRSDGEGTCQHVIGLLERHLDDLDRHIASLHKTRDHLVTLTKRAKALNPEECTDPNRCQTIAAGVEWAASPGMHTDHLHAQKHNRSRF